MNHGSLFSGIGGFDLAAEWMGWNNVFHCEWNDFGKKVLNYYWPEAISYDDITKTDFTIHRGNIDILTGGFPCQPYSAAGKRLGKEDERHLWPEMLRAVKEIEPRWIVGENVYGLVSWNDGMVFEEVQADLENLGYEVTAYILPACSVGAPHRRDRVWFVGYAKHLGRDATKERREEQKPRGKKKPHKIGKLEGTDCAQPSVVAYRASTGRKEREPTGFRQDQPEETTGVDNRPERHGNGGTTPDTGYQGLQGGAFNGSAGSGRTQRNKQFAGCVRPNWQNFPTQPPICSGDDGLSLRLSGITFPKWRNESIKAYGNAIVPQVAYQLFKAINQYEIRIGKNKSRIHTGNR